MEIKNIYMKLYTIVKNKAKLMLSADHKRVPKTKNTLTVFRKITNRNFHKYK